MIILHETCGKIIKSKFLYNIICIHLKDEIHQKSDKMVKVCDRKGSAKMIENYI